MNSIRVMFFKGNEPLRATEEQRKAYEHNDIEDELIQCNYKDVNIKEDRIYIDLLLHSDVVEVFDGVYKIEKRQFRAKKPYALWIIVGEKVE